MRTGNSSINKIVNQNSILLKNINLQTKQQTKIVNQMNKMVNLLKDYDEQNKFLALKLKQITDQNQKLIKIHSKSNHKIINRFKQFNHAPVQSARGNSKTSNLNTTHTRYNKSLKNAASPNKLSLNPFIPQFQASHNLQQPTSIEVAPIKSITYRTMLISPKQKLFERQLRSSNRVQVKFKSIRSSNLKQVGYGQTRSHTSAKSIINRSIGKQVNINNYLTSNQEDDQRVFKTPKVQPRYRPQSNQRKKYLSLTLLIQQSI